MSLQRLAAALALSASLLAAGCASCHHKPACAAPAPACGCNGPAGPGLAAPAPANPYPPGAVATPPPGAIIQR